MRAAVTSALLVAWLTPAAASAQATGVVDPPLSPRNANYTIVASLDPTSRTITGSEVIEWKNITTRSTAELQFHTYWNAWKNARSTFMRERALGRGRPNASVTDWARIDVTSIRLLTKPTPTDLTASKRFIAPDDGNAEDETVLAVTLPAPVEPGGGVTVEVTWTAHVPRTFARTGAIGNFFFIGQWFPKIGVLQDDGWNCHQFHSATEFFSDYGTYDASLTIPKGWLIGATGVERERHDEGDRTTYRYYQDDVHDFAWTTSPDYLERTARFEPERNAESRGNGGLPSVEMRLLLQPEHANQAERHFDAARTALKYYGEWFGPYPYSHITIVDPAYQSGTGGMEYPTIFTVGTSWLSPAVTTLEETAVHEAGHQFWYGIVGTNEFEDAWMDEGLNEFSTARAVARAYGPHYLEQRYFGGFLPYVFTDIPISRESDGNGARLYRPVAKTEVPSTPSYRYFPSAAVRNGITYGKTALWLNTMERWLGWPTLQRIMSAYFAKGKFAHPRPQDFFATANDVTGQDLGWFFDQAFRSSNQFDYGVQSLESVPAGDRFRTKLVVRRYGEGVFPVDVRVAFTNGESTVEHWDGRDRWKLYDYDRSASAVSAAVDPARVLLLDINRTNNSRTLEPKAALAARKWSMTWMVWLQDQLLSWAFFL